MKGGKKKALLVIRPGAKCKKFMDSIFSVLNRVQSYEMETYVCNEYEYEQDIIDMFSIDEKFTEFECIIFISPSSGFEPVAIDGILERLSEDTVSGISIPKGEIFKGWEMINNIDDAKLMAAEFQIIAYDKQIVLDAHAMAKVGGFNREDIIAIPYCIAKNGIDLTRGYGQLGEKFKCNIHVGFNTYNRGYSGCLHEQFKHIVNNRNNNKK